MRRRPLVLCCCLLASTPRAEDKSDKCADWANSGECEKNRAFMLESCATSCASSPQEPAATASVAAAAVNKGEWPHCQDNNTAINNGMGGPLLENLQAFGVVTGCFMDDCLRTDKFTASSIESCAKVCLSVPNCQFWTWGVEDGEQKCWIRSSDAGWNYDRNVTAAVSGKRSCAPKGMAPLAEGFEECWMQDFNYGTCCHPNYGASGNPTCWDDNWNYDRCCLPDRDL